MSLRNAAKQTRQFFGLETFSASALCRVIKKLNLEICEIKDTFRHIADCTSYTNDDISIAIESADNSEKDDVIPVIEKTIPNKSNREKIKSTLKSVFTPFHSVVLLAGNQPFSYDGKSKWQVWEKAGFFAMIGKFCRKFFTLYQRLII